MNKTIAITDAESRRTLLLALPLALEKAEMWDWWVPYFSYSR
ncbi:hypothetical protein QWZ10_08440 [Paracoccus cavernae]|uniref:Uncharacterized protein n=1 Tax=Paracoccus cavernae TaxID=1571207 RepID=A0ABT8D8U2_9RHOB|nr:hypothetical protein [Paracoccus cavernae]